MGPRGDPQIHQNPKRSGVSNFDENETGGGFWAFYQKWTKITKWVKNRFYIIYLIIFIIIYFFIILFFI